MKSSTRKPASQCKYVKAHYSDYVICKKNEGIKKKHPYPYVSSEEDTVKIWMVQHKKRIPGDTINTKRCRDEQIFNI